jgi:hypothetical protein
MLDSLTFTTNLINGYDVIQSREKEKQSFKITSHRPKKRKNILCEMIDDRNYKCKSSQTGAKKRCCNALIRNSNGVKLAEDIYSIDVCFLLYVWMLVSE